MPKRKGNFSAWRLEQLADPINAANYLNAALEDSPGIFLDAVKDVIQAHNVSKVAQKANVTRESLYRSFAATGNPTLETINSVLTALSLKLSKVVPLHGSFESAPLAGNVPRVHRPRRRNGRRGVRDRRQLRLPLDAASRGSVSSVPNGTSVGAIGTTVIATSSTFDTVLVQPQIGSPREEWGVYVPIPQSPSIPTYAYPQ